MIRRLVIFVLRGSLLLPLGGMAVAPYVPETTDPLLEPWRWRHEEALEGIGAICMDEAPDGTLWFGGSGCIASYDGSAVERIEFNEELLSKITHKKAVPWGKALLVMEDGGLLVVIGENLVLWKDGHWHVIVKDIGRSVFSCRLVRGAAGAVWMLMPGSLWRVDADLSGAVPVMQVGAPRELAAFCLDRSGDAWVVERSDDPFPTLIHIPMQGASSGAQETWRRYRVPSEHDMSGTHLICGGDGRLLYADASRSSGLLVFNPESREWTEQAEEQKFPGIFSLLQGRDGSPIKGSGQTKNTRP